MAHLAPWMSAMGEAWQQAMAPGGLTAAMPGMSNMPAMPAMPQIGALGGLPGMPAAPGMDQVLGK
ncbi:MAG: hypothetical protein RI920_1028, partial [Pseudomonadota bacterium]